MTQTFSIPASVTSRLVGNELVILDLATGTYFGLDPIGTRVWQMLEEGKSIAEVCAAIVAEYDVTQDIIEKDAQDLVRELEEKNLITTA